MRVWISLLLAVLLSGCLPIGIRGSTLPFQGAAESSAIAETSLAEPLRDSGQVAQLTHEHRRDSRQAAYR
ncbi:MAG TPA: hypothetical protein VF814_11590 [Casimicrobiaceae bacterium]